MKSTIPANDLPGISVIITSKNNSEELKKNLPFVLEQDYPNYEVIVVNSGSTDETDMVLNAAEIKYPHLYHTFVPAGADANNEKKLALTLGIKAAKTIISFLPKHIAGHALHNGSRHSLKNLSAVATSCWDSVS